MLLFQVLSVIFPTIMAVDSSCNYYQNMDVGVNYYVYNPQYPGSFAKNENCLWQTVTPEGYIVEANLNCEIDRILISTTGQPNLENAEVFCGSGNKIIQSKDNIISIGLQTNHVSKGGSFLCILEAKRKNPSPCDCGWKNISIGTNATRLQCVSQITMNEAYDPNDTTGLNDIAIIKTAEPIEFNFAVGPAFLPFYYYGSSFAGKTVDALDMLLITDLNVLDQVDCYFKVGGTIDQMCTYRSGHDACQGTIITWVRDHRLHHKCKETDADPYNAARGFFFCHMGWLLVRKHPDVTSKDKSIDIDDLYADPILRFQDKYYFPILVPVMCFLMPTIIPWYCWGEILANSIFTCVSFRFCFVLHITSLVNSAAHMWGFRPYDKNIYAAENKIVSFLALGEGWHNFHHTFPWDYKTAEFGNYSFNLTTLFIDCCYKLGLVHDLKSVPEKVIKQRVLRTGDGTHNVWQ